MRERLHSLLYDDQKYPILLHRAHSFNYVVFEYINGEYLHPDLQTLQDIFLPSYWIFAPWHNILCVLLKYSKCFKVNLSHCKLILGLLSSPGIFQAKSFVHTDSNYFSPNSNSSPLLLFKGWAKQKLINPSLAFFFVSLLRLFIAILARTLLSRPLILNLLLHFYPRKILNIFILLILKLLVLNFFWNFK